MQRESMSFAAERCRLCLSLSLSLSVSLSLAGFSSSHSLSLFCLLREENDEKLKVKSV